MNNPINNQVNNLVAIQVNSRKISCDGDDDKSKHPLVYLNMDKDDSVTCPYCGKHYFVKSPSFINIK